MGMPGNARILELEQNEGSRNEQRKALVTAGHASRDSVARPGSAKPAASSPWHGRGAGRKHHEKNKKNDCRDVRNRETNSHRLLCPAPLWPACDILAAAERRGSCTRTMHSMPSTSEGGSAIPNFKTQRHDGTSITSITSLHFPALPCASLQHASALPEPQATEIGRTSRGRFGRPVTTHKPKLKQQQKHQPCAGKAARLRACGGWAPRPRAVRASGPTRTPGRRTLGPPAIRKTAGVMPHMP